MRFSTNIPRPIRRVAGLVVCVGMTAAAPGCAGESPPETIDREAFVDAYVEIRTAALLRSQPALEGPVKDSVLRELGVTEEQLLTFADVHGDDLEFMRGVWADVSTALDSVVYRPLDAPDADSAGSR
ncbi:MAG TPA: hypothetical protein VJ925_07610 [Longimicrobiales bacterium]|nr:hypothetical protein [Longimicrobiales bacterium]